MQFDVKHGGGGMEIPFMPESPSETYPTYVLGADGRFYSTLPPFVTLA